MRQTHIRVYTSTCNNFRYRRCAPDPYMRQIGTLTKLAHHNWRIMRHLGRVLRHFGTLRQIGTLTKLAHHNWRIMRHLGAPDQRGGGSYLAHVHNRRICFARCVHLARMPGKCTHLAHLLLFWVAPGMRQKWSCANSGHVHNWRTNVHIWRIFLFAIGAHAPIVDIVLFWRTCANSGHCTLFWLTCTNCVCTCIK